MENETLQLLQPVSEERLKAWLSEFYGKPVTITKRELLRHRDLSRVERLWIADSLPASVIYKLVLPPWDIERDLYEHVLIPSISNSALMYMAAHIGDVTVMFMEDLGGHCLFNRGSAKLATKLGEELAKLHRAYSYRIDELTSVNVLPMLTPIDYEEFAAKLCQQLDDWNLIDEASSQEIILLMNVVASKLAGEPISLVHGDLYAENIINRGNRLYLIDWSWFTMIGVPLMDLATLTAQHTKNGDFVQWSDEIIDAYCYESGRKIQDVREVLPMAEALNQLLFLYWLIERRKRGIMGTTVGPVDNLIADVIAELRKHCVR